MSYSVFIERYAQKQIMKLDKEAIPIIKTAIDEDVIVTVISVGHRKDIYK